SGDRAAAWRNDNDPLRARKLDLLAGRIEIRLAALYNPLFDPKKPDRVTKPEEFRPLHPDQAFPGSTVVLFAADLPQHLHPADPDLKYLEVRFGSDVIKPGTEARHRRLAELTAQGVRVLIVPIRLHARYSATYGGKLKELAEGLVETLPALDLSAGS